MTKFLRWCLFKAEQSRPSVFALVLPSTFANNISFVPARKFLFEHVSEMWVLEFDADNRAGHQAENLFNTLQGRLLLIGTLREIDTNLPSVHYKSIYNLGYKEKLEYLELPVDNTNWDVVKMTKDYLLKPIANFDENLYSQFWHIASDSEPSIFERHCSGLKLAPTHLLVHFNEGQLKRRNKFIADEANSYEEIKDRWYKGQTKPPAQKKLSLEVRKCLSNNKLQIVDYSYRPFLTAKLLFDNSVMDALRRTEGGGMRERPEVQAAYANKSVFGFAVAPAPADISPKIHKFTSFCWSMPDNDLATRGNAHVFCNKFPDYKKTQKDWNGKCKRNINDKLLKALAERYKVSDTILVDELVFYAYAVLNSNIYLHAFEGKLYSTAGEWPAIPIPMTYDLLNRMSVLGKKMAEVEQTDYQSVNQQVAIGCSLMDREINMEYTISEGSVKIHDINSKETFAVQVPDEILTFQASGYEIVREWLKYHSYNYYRKACGKKEFEELQNLFGRILDFKSLVTSADFIMSEILQSELINPTCSQRV